MTGEYPNFKDIKVHWTKFHTLIVMVITFSVILFLINQAKSKPITLTQYLNVAGLYLDFWGVIIASLKTPYYGAFFDAGKIEIERQKVESKYLNIGMILIFIGMLLQVLSTLNNFLT
ncbi:hypothetical protein [Flavobacterium lacustre]|uniref:hypothetical protein n=1 Tax=Flavobacterium lacustre TaxID=3016339 RepID=UPI0022B69AB4|nr:hypothetical protein [Flavobacterium lacustre]